MSDIANTRGDESTGNNLPTSSTGHPHSLLRGSEPPAPPPHRESPARQIQEPAPLEMPRNEETIARLLRVVESSNFAQRLQGSDDKAPEAQTESSVIRPPERAPIETFRKNETGPRSIPAVERTDLDRMVQEPERTDGPFPHPAPAEIEERSANTLAFAPLITNPPCSRANPAKTPPSAPLDAEKATSANLHNPIRRLASKIGEYIAKLDKPADPRQNPRLLNPPLVAFFWTGEAPAPHGIADISSSGLYMRTSERWSPGTRLSIKLRRTDRELESNGSSLSVDVVIVRSGFDGLGGAFVPCAPGRAGSGERTVDGGWATKLDLKHFVDHLIVSD